MAIVEEATIRPAPTTGVRLAHGRARLVLRHPSRVGGWVDGGWWPHTLDLAGELRLLIQAVRRAGFDPTGVTYQLPAWSAAPRELTIEGRQVRLRGYRSHEPDSITLTDSSGWDRLELLVIPPAAAPEVADFALQLAGGADRRRAHDILHHASEARALNRPTERDRPRSRVS
jgi:hypothetical protein